MKVTPSLGLAAEGPTGGPFSPDSVIYTLTNYETTSIGYSVTESIAWIDVSSTSGTIPAESDVQVTVSINAAANALSNGFHEGEVSFLNTTNGDGDTTRTMSVEVGVPVVQYEWNMDVDPGWSIEAQWTWGQPTGGGGEYGNPDPTSGHTGSNVCGYNLSGDYTNSMPEYDLTTTAIDCSDLTQVTLKFWRWLNVEQPTYDHAYLRVSNDNTNWDDVWWNVSEVADSSWQQFEYDISGIADNQETVYIRWTMGTTDTSWLYSGWNIDDVEIWGVATSTCTPMGDMNGDGAVEGDDIQAYLDCKINGGPDCDCANMAIEDFVNSLLN